MTSNAGFDTFLNGLGGISGNFGNLFDSNGIAVMLSFGIPTTIGLLSGTFGDQMFWQRVFCVKQDKVKRTMITAAFIFAIVPISLASFGFFASGAGLAIADTQLVNVGAVIAFTPKWFLYLFFMLILSGLISTVDSILCAVSSIAGHDVAMRISDSGKPGAITAIRIGDRLLSHQHCQHTGNNYHLPVPVLRNFEKLCNVAHNLCNKRLENVRTWAVLRNHGKPRCRPSDFCLRKPAQ